MERTSRILLLVAGATSMAMAVYHFFMPTLFHWGSATEPAPPILRWALFALNAFFSTLLLLTGGLVLATAWGRRHRHAPGTWVVAAGATFWAVNLGYQLTCPMPLPEALAGVQIGLAAFSVGELLLHTFPLAFALWGSCRSRVDTR